LGTQPSKKLIGETVVTGRKNNRRVITSGEKALTIGAVEKLLDVINDIRDETLLRLAITGGLRREDIVKIFIKDIDFDNCAVTFYQHKKKNIHTVFLPDSTMLSLEKLIRVQKRLKSPYLFPSSKPKRHLSSRTAYNILQKYLKIAGLPSIPFHALRSTCVKLCQARGWSPEQSAKHIDDTLTTIQRHYTTPSEEERKETAKEKPIL